MPTYEYVCRACGHEFEEFQSIKADPIQVCPKCRKRRVERKIGIGAGVLFKGGGFYETDYRSDSYTKSAEAEKKAREATSDAAAGSKPDAKADAKSDAKADPKSSPKTDTKTDAKTAPEKSPAPAATPSGANESKATHRSRVGRGVGNILQNPPKPKAKAAPAPKRGGKKR